MDRLRIDGDIDILLAEVEDLPDLEKEWTEISDDDRGATYHEWANNAGVLEELEEAYRASRITPEREEWYLVLKAKVTAHAPILERLGLKAPPNEVLAG